MKIDTYKEFFIYNGEFRSDKDLELKSGEKVYEVIRIIDGKPLFLKEHLERIQKSTRLLGYEPRLSDEDIKESISELIKKDEILNMNIKIVFNFYEDKFESVFYFIKSNYPEEYVYDEGVKVISIKAERDNPNIKRVNVNFKEMIKNKLNENKAFEALLIDENGCTTEGSRSNMFFVKGDTIYTSPSGEVLLGVTRANILKACDDLNINVIEKNLRFEELDDIDALFMSGTSIGVLPIGIVDDKEYSSSKNNIIKKLRSEYEKRAINDIKSYRL